MLPGYTMGNTYRIRGTSETEGGGDKKSDPGGPELGRPSSRKCVPWRGACSLWARLGIGQHIPELEGKEGRAGSHVGRWGERSGSWWRPRTQDLAIVWRGDAFSLQFPCSSSL